MTLHTGDCLDVMPTLAAGSVDAVVTDPPYDLTGHRWDSLGTGKTAKQSAHVKGRGGFMGRAWDGTGIAFDPATWEAALRVAAPGAYLLAFGGTRTVHRMTRAIEDAGWVIRDVLCWVYASGFPKSRASLKPAWEPIVMARKPGASSPLQIDAARIGTDTDRGARYSGKPPGGGMFGGQQQDEPWDVPAGRWPANVVLTDTGIFDGDVPGVVGGGRGGNVYGDGNGYTTDFGETGQTVGYGDTGTYSRFFTVPVTIGACRYCGVPIAPASSTASPTPDIPSGTAPEPASSPLSSSRNDPAPSAAIRSGEAGASSAPPSAALSADGTAESDQAAPSTSATASGMWAEHEPTTPLTPRSKPRGTSPRSASPSDPATTAAPSATSSATTTTTPDRWTCESCVDLVTRESTPAAISGGRRGSREVPADQPEYTRFLLIPKADRAEREPLLTPVGHDPSKRFTTHPTIKPLDLMRHLVRLVTPPGGTVLDCFAGSGTTLIAAEMEGFPWVGIEREPEYVAIAEARLMGVQRGMGLDVPAPTPEWKDYPTATRYPVKGPSQSSWFTESTRETDPAL